MNSLIHFLAHTWFFGAMPIMFFGIGQGPSKEQKSLENLLSSNATFASGLGKNLTSQGASYWSDLLSGDPTKIAAAIAPETKVIQGQAQQQKKQLAEFSSRSGGSTAAAAAIDTNALSQTQDLVNRARTAAAGEVSSLGTNLLSQGTGAAGSAFDAASSIQKLSAAKWNDIFGSIADVLKTLSGIKGIKGTGLGDALNTSSGAFGG